MEGVCNEGMQNRGCVVQGQDIKFMPHLENEKQQIIITGLFVLTQTILLSFHAVTKTSSCWVPYAIICNEITAVLSDSPA